MTTQVEQQQRGIALPMLRTLRERRGLSQEELATLAGVARATIINLEHGATHARASSAAQLAQALGVPLNMLSGAQPLTEDEPAPPRGILSDYFAAAMCHAVYRRVGGEPERVYAAIPGIPGLWARGMSREEVERDLHEALEWFVLTAVFDHQPLPSFDQVSLEITEESAKGEAVLYPVAAQNTAGFLDDDDSAVSPLDS